jgi:hypothetical protein
MPHLTAIDNLGIATKTHVWRAEGTGSYCEVTYGPI